MQTDPLEQERRYTGSTKLDTDKKTPWYGAGLHFKCTCCGNCCSGPGEGVIWITKPEIEFLAEFLQLSVEEVHEKYLRPEGARTSIDEHPLTKDCIFLKRVGGQRQCTIYPVRPNQCRTWPFWASNLASPRAWNENTQDCPGVNHGPVHTQADIEEQKKQTRWWTDEKT